MTVQARLKTQAELADKSCELLEQAHALGFGEYASEYLAQFDGRPILTKKAQVRLRKLIVESKNRMRDTGCIPQSPIAALGANCDALAMKLRTRALMVRYYDHHLARESIFASVCNYLDAQENTPKISRRGKPSPLTTVEARSFIIELADIWSAYTGRPPHPGGGETTSFNFNNFIVHAFEVAGQTVNAHTVPRVTRKILTGQGNIAQN